MFDFSVTAGAKESGRRLEPGIKNCIFNGISFSKITSQKTGDDYKTLCLNLKIDDYGDYIQNFFEPDWSKERVEGQYGLQPSPVDHFLISVRQILEALDKENLKDDGNVTYIRNSKGEYVPFKGSTFKQLVDLVADATKPFIGKPVEVKFIPQNNGYCSIPSFPAKIDRNGGLGISTRFIGHDLVLSAGEVKKIEAAKAAKPTVMSSKTSANDVLDAMAKNLGVDKDEDDDDGLPF